MSKQTAKQKKYIKNNPMSYGILYQYFIDNDPNLSQPSKKIYKKRTI